MSRSGRSLLVRWSNSHIVKGSSNNEPIQRLDDKYKKGQASVELVLILLILVPLLVGGIELARGVGIRHALDSGVGVATRALSLDPGQWSWATTIINQAVQRNILGGGSVGPVNVTAYDAGGSSIAPTALASLPFGSPFRLDASCTYTPEIPLVGGQVVTINVSHWGIVERYP